MQQSHICQINNNNSHFQQKQMSSNLNIDLLFKKYSQYFAYSQTASTHQQMDDRPTARAKNNNTQKEHIKSETVKLKSSKTIKAKLKAENKDTLTDTKKTKSIVSNKVTPRCQISTKHGNTKLSKVEKKYQRSITPDRVPRKSLSRTPIGVVKKVGDKNNPKIHKQNKQKNQRSKSREFHPLTDRSMKIKTQRSKSRDYTNGDKSKIQKNKLHKPTIKQPKGKPLPPHIQYTLKTQYAFDRDSFHEHFNFEEQRLRYNIPERSKLRNQELFYEQQQQQQESYETRKKDYANDMYLKIPIITSREQRASISSKQDQSSNEYQQRQSYYKQLIEKMKQQQEQKWRRTVTILKQYREVGDKQMLNKIIDQSEQNRKNIIQKQNRQQIFQKYKTLYDEDHAISYSSPKQKISYIRSREASSKKLMQDLEQSHLNQIQLENHFSSNKQISLKDSISCRRLNFLIGKQREQKQQIFEREQIKQKEEMQQQQREEQKQQQNEEAKQEQKEQSQDKRQIAHQYIYQDQHLLLSKQKQFKTKQQLFNTCHNISQKSDNLLLSTHNVNIEQYLLSQSKKSESPRHDSPSYDRIQHQRTEQSRSQQNSLIEFIQNQLQEIKKEKKAEDGAIFEAVSQQVFQSEVKLFGEQIMQSGQVLHNFLKYTNTQFNTQQEKVVQPEVIEVFQTIECSNSFIAHLVRSFLEYIQKNMLEDFNIALTVPFGEKPLKMLRFMRDSGENQENEGGYQSIVPVSLFIEFEPTLKQKVHMSSNLEQYFFNHCIFDCVNQNLDKLRPFGLKGLPPLCFQTNFSPMKFPIVYQYLLCSVRNILSFGIGRDIDQCQQEDAFKIIDTTFRKLDKLILVETDQEWKDNNDLQFELKYDVAAAVADWIFKQEAKALVYLIL